MKQTKQVARHKYCELCHKMSEGNIESEFTKYKINFLFNLTEEEIYRKTRYMCYINFLIEG